VFQDLTVIEATALISAATAVLAVIIGPVSGYLIAKRQINAQLVSANRQVWINQLRDHLAAVHSLLFRLPTVLKRPGELSQEETKEVWDQFRDALEQVTLIRGKIVLMLNPSEEPHQQLARLLDQALSAASEHGADTNALVKYRDDLTRLSQSILKAEWERVKLGR
jgi:chromosome segregation ATPase